MWKSVKMHFSVNTKILEFLKVHNFFHALHSTALFLNPHSRVCQELFSQKESENYFFWKKNVIFDQKLLIFRLFRNSFSKFGNYFFLIIDCFGIIWLLSELLNLAKVRVPAFLKVSQICNFTNSKG